METQDRHAQSHLIEVILCFENNSWLFSTYAKSIQIEDALDKAEDEFLIHTALHDIRTPKATSAYVLTESGKYFVSKQNGKWQTSSALAAPLLPDVAEMVLPFPMSGRARTEVSATVH
jgi:hypothetical protein